jgi:hypothetical protein
VNFCRDWPISSEGLSSKTKREHKMLHEGEDVEVAVGNNVRHKPYSMASLDNDWYAVFSGVVRAGGTDDPDGRDVAAGFIAPNGGVKPRPLGGEDDIDGRGSFDAKELEKELRRMRRDELEDKLGEYIAERADWPQTVSKLIIIVFQVFPGTNSAT